MTTYSPQFLGLPEGVWTQEGGDRNAGEGIVIGFVDTGINPSYPSFAYDSVNPFTANISHFSGACETGPQFPPFSCNGKIISASHVASTDAGNAGVSVMVNGFNSSVLQPLDCWCCRFQDKQKIPWFSSPRK
ncbi:hypothetical protein REPUB_Repub13aG0270600 [Reevesia pubescens]